MDDSYSYSQAFAELQEIVAEIEQGEISIDELSEKVKRASLLIAACKAKLTATEADVSAILEALKPADATSETESELMDLEEADGEASEQAPDADVTEQEEE